MRVDFPSNKLPQWRVDTLAIALYHSSLIGVEGGCLLSDIISPTLCVHESRIARLSCLRRRHVIVSSKEMGGVRVGGGWGV